MQIEWNKVTWYSKLFAVLLFVATFAVAFYLGIAWEKTRITTSLFASALPSESTPASSTGSVASSTPDSTQSMTVVTQADRDTTIHLKKNERFALQLGDQLKWNVTFAPANAITPVANSVSTGGFQGVYEADKTGTATMTATGAPICKPDEMCAQFLVNVTVTFVVGS